MNIYLVKNIEFHENRFILSGKNGVVVSQFHLEFDEDIHVVERDHCECISVLPICNGNKLEITIVSDKDEIDEYIIFRMRIGKRLTNLKIRFIRCKEKYAAKDVTPS